MDLTTSPGKPVALILCADPVRTAALAGRANAEGFTAVTGDAAENGAGALIRVQPRVLVIDVDHPAAEATNLVFEIARGLGTTVIIAGRGMEAIEQPLLALGGNLPLPLSPHPHPSPLPSWADAT